MRKLVRVVYQLLAVISSRTRCFLTLTLLVILHIPSFLIHANIFCCSLIIGFSSKLVSLVCLRRLFTPLDALLLESCTPVRTVGLVARLQALIGEPVLFPYPELATRAACLACMSIQTYASPAYISSYAARADFFTSGSVQSGGVGSGQSGPAQLSGLQQQQQSISPSPAVNQSTSETTTQVQVRQLSITVYTSAQYIHL